MERNKNQIKKQVMTRLGMDEMRGVQGGNGSYAMKDQDPQAVLVALLLPAVQQVREAAISSVQQVREAA